MGQYSFWLFRNGAELLKYYQRKVFHERKTSNKVQIISQTHSSKGASFSVWGKENMLSSSNGEIDVDKRQFRAFY